MCSKGASFLWYPNGSGTLLDLGPGCISNVLHSRVYSAVVVVIVEAPWPTWAFVRMVLYCLQVFLDALAILSETSFEGDSEVLRTIADSMGYTREYTDLRVFGHAA